MVARSASAVQWAQSFIAPVLVPGCLAVDATAGNGQDTLFLARGVGPQGKVFAFDIQIQALEKTREELAGAGLLDRVILLAADHREMAAHVPGAVKAVMFNLGYLPGGDHRIITRPESTLEALKAALSLLASGGRISLVVYTGHPGAAEELRVVEEFTRGLSPRHYTVVRLSFWNRSSRAPVVILLEKAGAET
ncbi:tRNA G37 N-methylase Trm5 [Desulfofundulus luciae]|uniref:tRNA G37 N-methylase Trm5 n=1 Tax=Desulfofundulus luciae TaxID=74702 RepID=A0ABU0B1I5_9FIRM|nr:class I SAM-dependent methyltransferase [Desulfofundulus luciae]MDQ0286580.1 tRNA G37 N-methylase Trm5 [Desulfofundulus luciae]